MIVKKRDGRRVKFNKEKVKVAVLKAFLDVDGEETTYAKDKAREIANYIETLNKNMNVEEIQDEIISKLMASSRKDVATKYVEYRYKRKLIRESNTTDKSILELLDGTNDYWNNENSNKDAKTVTVQRDYLAGITSTDITHRFLLEDDIVEAHNEGILHFHDADYFAQHIHNCDLLNLEDMLQNGTVLNGVMIEKQHRFLTACTVATQIITAVASSQYGGVTISLTHLAPFIRDSYNIYLKKYLDREHGEQDSIKWAKEDLAKEIADGVQTFNYQINSMSTTNGQAPFLSVFMYLGETKEYKEELSMLIEEFLKQRIVSMKNEVGIYVTQAFPKLLYVLEEDNIHEDSKYYYLTKLAAKCTAKRMVPDYISEKIMLESKIDKNGNGNVYPCMGCVDGDEVITYKFKGKLYIESFKRMWNRLSDNFEVKGQYVEYNPNVYMDLKDVEIYDTEKGFANVRKLIRNISDDWVDIHLSNGRRLLCTTDHPFSIIGKGVVQAKDLAISDRVIINSSQNNTENIQFNEDKAWLLGFMLCDGCYQSNHIFASIAKEGEDEIENKFHEVFPKYFSLNTKTVLQKRGQRGNYKDLIVEADDKGNLQSTINYFTSKFGGINKINRHIPNEVFEWSKQSKYAFMAGMIDADGHINAQSHGGSVVQIGSTNKELSIQQMALAQALGMPAKIYHNHYNKNNPSAIRYRVEFYPDDELIRHIVCNKKKDNYTTAISKHYNTYATILDINPIDRTAYSYDVETESGHFEVSGIYSHNCRSFLTPYVDENGRPKYYGRFNQGVVTINLPDIAFSSNRDINKFWELFEERTELCHKALQCRHERLTGTLSDAAPILWQNGALSRLNKGEPIDKLLHDGYSTISLGYAGLYECVKYMTGKSHTDGDVGEKFGLEVMQKLNDKCNQWKKEEKIDYSLYGTPMESGTYKFAKSLKKRFGDDIFVKLDGEDRDYITNSYHIPVFEKIDPFEKLSIESKFQKLSPGGAISYIECADLNSNIDAVLEVLDYIYNNIMYAELNTKSDYCQVCGYDGEIKIVDKNNSLIWECPNCKNRDKDKMNVARRTCGYIGTNYWNAGRTDEIAHRYVHMDNHDIEERG